MKIGCKKIRPMANPVPLPKALASLTLYIMLIMASMILISTMIMEIIKLSFVSRVPCQPEICRLPCDFIRNIIAIYWNNTFPSGLPCFGKDSPVGNDLQKPPCECDHQIHTAQEYHAADSYKSHLCSPISFCEI